MYEPANTLSATPLTDRINTLVAAFVAELTGDLDDDNCYGCADYPDGPHSKGSH